MKAKVILWGLLLLTLLSACGRPEETTPPPSPLPPIPTPTTTEVTPTPSPVVPTATEEARPTPPPGLFYISLPYLASEGFRP